MARVGRKFRLNEVDKCRLASAVGADERRHITLWKTQGDVVNSFVGVKRLVEIEDAKKIRAAALDAKLFLLYIVTDGCANTFLGVCFGRCVATLSSKESEVAFNPDNDGHENKYLQNEIENRPTKGVDG